MYFAISPFHALPSSLCSVDESLLVFIFKLCCFEVHSRKSQWCVSFHLLNERVHTISGLNDKFGCHKCFGLRP